MVANQDVYEGTAAGAVTINFRFYVRRLTITNDSGSSDLQFKLNNSETYATLKPTETISMDVRTPTLFLNGNAPYRVWGWG